MATLVLPRHKLRTDNVFFSAMAVLALAIVLIGFAQSYFLAGMLRAKLPNALVHVHGALFVSWILLLLVQTSLVAVRRVQWHRTLGLLAVVIAPLMVVVGILTVIDSIRRNSGAGPPPEILLVGDTVALLLFSVLIGWGMLARRNPIAHKRLMILGTFAILGPAIDRWHLGLPLTFGIYFLLPLLLVLYDLASRRRVQRSTATATLLIFAITLTILPLSHLTLVARCVALIRQT